MTSPLPRVIGHRGAATHAPENTLAGLSRAAELGAPWVEFDVRLTADKVAILHHDDTLKRTAGRNAAAASLTYKEIAELDAGAWYGNAFHGERVPTLSETLKLLGQLGLGANIEIKPAPGHEAETARVALELVKKEWPARLPAPLISSFSTVSRALSRTKTFVGTPGFQAPEVAALGEDAHKRAAARADGGGGYDGALADAFSLGATLYVMLVGRFPEFERDGATGARVGVRFRDELWNGVSADARALNELLGGKK